MLYETKILLGPALVFVFQSYRHQYWSDLFQNWHSTSLITRLGMGHSEILIIQFKGGLKIGIRGPPCTLAPLLPCTRCQLSCALILEKVLCHILRHLRGQSIEGLSLAALSTVSSETLKNVKGTKNAASLPAAGVTQCYMTNIHIGMLMAILPGLPRSGWIGIFPSDNHPGGFSYPTQFLLVPDRRTVHNFHPCRWVKNLWKMGGDHGRVRIMPGC